MGGIRLYTQSILWVCWNIFLALIPVVLGYLINKIVSSTSPPRRLKVAIPIALLFLVWLAFLPNTCYLLTEWRHFLGKVLHSDIYRQAETNHSALFRLNVAALYYILYSGLGVFCFTLAIRPIERTFRILGWKFPYFAPFLFLFISIGVYLGLILRLNSWYVITRPDMVFLSILGIAHSKALVLAIIVFMMVIWALYEGLDLWLDAFLDRMGKILKRCQTG